MFLTVLIFLPLAGALPLLWVRDQNAREVKVWALLVSIAAFLLSLRLWTGFDLGPGAAPFQFAVDRPWIRWRNLHVNYAVGADGISALLLLLTTFLTPLALLGSWNYIKERQKEFYLAMLFLETALLGVFASLDLFLFYVFFEASLIPMYLIIGIWGGKERLYATTKFVIYTVFGSLLLFLAILYIYFHSGTESFSIAHLTDRLAALRELNARDPSLGFTRTEELWCFGGFALAFAIKVPLFPLHTWLPDAHVEAPTPGSVILAAILLKMGGYGFLRLAVPFFPRAVETCLPLLLTICIIGILYGSLMAFAQADMKKLIAYSSVAHLGTCMLGVFSLRAEGVYGGVYQMLNHGLSTGALFLLAGMLYERTHTRTIAAFGGLAKVMPVYTTCFIIVTLSSIGLPLTNGFIGEFACLFGAFQQNPWWAALGGLGVILGAVYMLNLVKEVFFGKLGRPGLQQLPDLNRRELGLLLPILVMIFVMGVAPRPFFQRLDPAVNRFLRQAHPATARAPVEVVKEVAAMPADEARR